MNDENQPQPSDINLMVYPQGESRTVVSFDRLVDLLSYEKLIYLNGKIASKLIDIESARGES